MKKQLVLLIAIAAIFASSCSSLSSLYPLTQNEKGFLYKKELIGKWRDTKDSSGYCTIDTIAGSGGKLYSAEVSDIQKDNSMRINWFLFRLIKINESYFLDCRFDLKKETASEEDYDDLVIAKHFFFTISFAGTDKLEVSSPDPDEFKKLMDQKKIALSYTELSEGDYLILNKSKQLANGLTASKKYSQVYKSKNILVRLK